MKTRVLQFLQAIADIVNKAVFGPIDSSGSGDMSGDDLLRTKRQDVSITHSHCIVSVPKICDTYKFQCYTIHELKI